MEVTGRVMTVSDDDANLGRLSNPTVSMRHQESSFFPTATISPCRIHQIDSHYYMGSEQADDTMVETSAMVTIIVEKS